MRAFLLLNLAFGCAAQLTAEEAGPQKNRPIAKVVGLLRDMHKKLEAEQKTDNAAHTKFQCWCDTNKKTKAHDSKNNQAESERQRNSENIQAAGGAKAEVESKNAKQDLKETQESLVKAQHIRDEHLAEFNAEEKEMLLAITSLKAAINVLKKHHSLLQKDQVESMRHVAMLLSYNIHRYSGKIKVNQKQKDLVSSLLQGTYAPASGEIFGILENMESTFQTNLQAARDDEATQKKQFAELKDAKLAEIDRLQGFVSKKDDEAGDAGEASEQAKAEKEELQKQIGNDAEFTKHLTSMCRANNDQYDHRLKKRNEEIAAVSKAIEILGSNSAHEQFDKNFANAPTENPFAFIQQAQMDRREAAARVVARVPQLSMLATRIRLDAFTKVTKAIDDMIDDLEKQQADEVKQQHFCTKELNDNASDTQEKNLEKGDTERHMEKLDAEIKERDTKIKALADDIADLKLQMKHAGENREKDYEEFKAEVTNQRSALATIESATKVLAEYYQKDFDKTMLMSSAEQATHMLRDDNVPKAPKGFSDGGEFKKAQSGGDAVISMLKEAASDTKMMMDETLADERHEQAEYEKFVVDTNTSVDEKMKEKTLNEEAKAKAEYDHNQADIKMKAIHSDLETLDNTLKALHKSCDFVLENFEKRQDARGNEIKALNEAKQILAGSDFNPKSKAFLQRK